MNKPFKLLKDIFDKISSKLTTRKLEETLLSSSLSVEQQIREELRRDLRTFYENETLIRTYATSQVERVLIVSAPEHIKVASNEQLAARVSLVSVTGQRYDVDIFWKTGENFTTDSFYSKIAGNLVDKKLKGATRSEIARSAIVEANYYIQRWSPLSAK